MNKMAPKWTVLPKMNSAPQNEQCSQKWTEAPLLYHWLPKTNGATQYEHLKKKNLRKWPFSLQKREQNLPKKIVIRYLYWEGILGEKFSAVGHSSP